MWGRHLRRSFWVEGRASSSVAVLVRLADEYNYSRKQLRTVERRSGEYQLAAEGHREILENDDNSQFRHKSSRASMHIPRTGGRTITR